MWIALAEKQTELLNFPVVGNANSITAYSYYMGTLAKCT
jgi:hypothetical protein